MCVFVAVEARSDLEADTGLQTQAGLLIFYHPENFSVVQSGTNKCVLMQQSHTAV